MRPVIPHQPLYPDVKKKRRKEKKNIIKLFNSKLTIILQKGSLNLSQRINET